MQDSGKSGVFTLESVLTGENLREVEIRHLLSLYALSKTKHTSHRSFFQFLIILSGDVSLNPGPVRHPCSSCLKPVAKITELSYVITVISGLI